MTDPVRPPTLVVTPEYGAPTGETADLKKLVRWLDYTLRPKSSISVADDLPLLMEDSPRTVRRVMHYEGRIVAHAAAYEITIDYGGNEVRAALIGGVATDMAHRRRGLASQIVQSVLDALTERGVALAMLWSDVPGLYEPLGFALAGCETLHSCPRADWPLPRGSRARPLVKRDIPAVAALHDREPCRVRRDLATWSRLLAMPATNAYVIERKEGVVAYAIVGKGHDLQGCLHEWGGDDLLLPPLASAILTLRMEDSIYIMSPPWKLQARLALAFHGVAPVAGAIGMMRVLDRSALLESLGVSVGIDLPESDMALVHHLFGDAEHRPDGDGAFPLPFYVFGLDSM
jgi:GNAT superfamily N-acetyltransferase